MPISSIDFSSLTQCQVAEMLDYTPRSIRYWEGEGLPRNLDGTYSAALVIAWFIVHRAGPCWLRIHGQRRRRDA